MNHFYVYIYLDPRKIGVFKYDEFEFTHEPFYVGKGKGGQWRSHLSEKLEKSHNKFKVGKINKIIKELNIEPIIFKLKESLLEQEAFDLEIKLIKLIGRHNLQTGPLTNLTDGGEGFSGFKYTEEMLIDYRYGDNNPNYGNGQAISGSKNPMFNKKHSIETKEKIGRKSKERNQGKNHPMYGKEHPSKGKHIHDEDSKNAISIAHLGKIVSEDTRLKQSIKMKNRNLTKGNNPSSKKVLINGQIFTNIKEGLDKFNITYTDFYRSIRNNVEGFEYIK